MYHSLFICVLAEGHLCCFHVLVMINIHPINIPGQDFVCVCACMFLTPLGKCQGTQLLDNMVRLCLVLQETAKLSLNGYTILHSHQEWIKVPLAPHPCQHFHVISVQDFGYSNRYAVVSRHFNLHFVDENGFSFILLTMTWKAEYLTINEVSPAH